MGRVDFLAMEARAPMLNSVVTQPVWAMAAQVPTPRCFFLKAWQRTAPADNASRIRKGGHGGNMSTVAGNGLRSLSARTYPQPAVE